MRENALLAIGGGDIHARDFTVTHTRFGTTRRNSVGNLVSWNKQIPTTNFHPSKSTQRAQWSCCGTPCFHLGRHILEPSHVEPFLAHLHQWRFTVRVDRKLLLRCRFFRKRPVQAKRFRLRVPNSRVRPVEQTVHGWITMLRLCVFLESKYTPLLKTNSFLKSLPSRTMAGTDASASCPDGR